MPLHFIGMPFYSFSSTLLANTNSPDVSSFKDIYNYLKESKVNVNRIPQCETQMLDRDIFHCKFISSQLDSVAIPCRLYYIIINVKYACVI